MPNPVSSGPAVRPFAESAVFVASCPIQASLAILGRKWALTLLRDVAFYENMRFSDILRNNSGLTPRILSMRLSDLSSAGFVTRLPSPQGGRAATYSLTAKGEDTIPILIALTNFGIRHHADVVFPDGKPRTLGELLPGSQCEMLGSLKEYADQLPAPDANHSITPPVAEVSQSPGTARVAVPRAPKARAARPRRPR